MPPCVLFEDDHLLVVNKPAGWNTHAPSPFAGEGIYEWLKHREPRWAGLAIIHRLDKETSGVMVFGKSPRANRSLTGQFATRAVRKNYLLLTDREPKQREFTVKSKLARAGERYVSGAHGDLAETRFRVVDLKSEISNLKSLAAAPLTGRTHQVRVHAAESGFPIFGDTLYGGTPWARICLHAAELSFKHPVTGAALSFAAPVRFEENASLGLRAAIIEPETTDSFRLIHGASDGWPGWYVDRLGAWLLSQSEGELKDEQRARLEAIGAPSTGSAPSKTMHQRAEAALGAPIRGAYHKSLSRYVRSAAPAETSPHLLLGEAAPDRFTIRENGVRFELSFSEGYSVGLFLDQGDNRGRLLTGCRRDLRRRRGILCPRTGRDGRRSTAYVRRRHKRLRRAAAAARVQVVARDRFGRLRDENVGNDTGEHDRIAIRGAFDLDRRIHQLEGALEERQVALDGKKVFARRPVNEPHDERGPPRFAAQHQHLAAGNQFGRQDFGVADGEPLDVLCERQAPVLRLDDGGQTTGGRLGVRCLRRWRPELCLGGDGRSRSKGRNQRQRNQAGHTPWRGMCHGSGAGP